MNDIKNLKPCPCCGGEAQYASDGGCRLFTVFCTNCGLEIIDHGSPDYGKEWEVVTAKWNKRISNETVEVLHEMRNR